LPTTYRAPGHTRKRAHLVLAGIVAFGSASCDVGGVLVVDNRSNESLVVSVTGRAQDPAASMVTYVTRQDDVAVPAHARLAVAVLPFAPLFMIEKVEVRTEGCIVLATLAEGAGISFARDGNVIVVEGDLSAELVHEFPRDGALAAPTDRCTAWAPSRVTLAKAE
jgi:hypothetical protein